MTPSPRTSWRLPICCDGSARPLIRVLLPLAGPLLLAGGGLLFLLSLLDYGIPSIFQVNVLALDIFADFSVHGQAGRALLVSVPLLAATVGAITLSQGRLRDAAMAPPIHRRKAVTTERWPRWLVALSTGAVAIVMPAVLGPIVSLAAQVGSWQQLSAVLDGGRGEIVYSFGVSLAAALLSLPLAAIAAQRIVGGTPLGRAWWLAVTLPMALPGPLVGIGLIRLWNSPVIAFTSVYGSRWMPVLAALARYVPLGALVMTAALRRTDPSLIDAARVLQASRRRRLVLVHLPMLAPGLLAAGAVVFCLTLGELSATLLVAAPGHPTLIDAHLQLPPLRRLGHGSRPDIGDDGPGTDPRCNHSVGADAVGTLDRHRSSTRRARLWRQRAMIALRNLEKRYGHVQALGPVSLEIPAGTTTVIQGPSGSGKTTLLRLIAGLERPSNGEIHIGGALAGSPDHMQPPHDRGVGFVFQTPSLWPHMTVAQNVAFGLLGRPRSEIRERVGRILAHMALDRLSRRYPNQISGGQARRVAIARTLVTRPRRLLLDEPLTHLEDELKVRVIELILSIAGEEASTLVYVTHSPSEARDIGGTLLKLVDGVFTTSTDDTHG